MSVEMSCEAHAKISRSDSACETEDECDARGSSECRNGAESPCLNLTAPLQELRTWTICCVAALLSILVYARAFTFNSFKNGFHMDDVVAIQKNLDVVNPGWTDWAKFLRHDFWGLDMFSGDWTHKSFRPVTTFSYRINWLLSGLDTSAYHVTNILLHAGASVVLTIMCVRVLRLGSFEALSVGSLFALHPVHTESILYLVGRADVICALFMFSAVLLHNSNRDFSAYLVVALAGLSKELGFMTFPVFTVLDVVRGHPKSRLGATLVVAVAMMWLRHWYTDGTELKMSPQDNPVSFEEDDAGRRISYAIIHGEYFRLLVNPWFLCYDYSLNTIPIACWFDDLRLLSAAASYLGCAGVVWFTLKRRDVASLVGIALFAFSFVPMSNILFPVGTVVGERLLYIPSAGFLIVLTRLIPKRMQIALVGVIACMWLLRTTMRVADWQTANHLTRVDGTVNPKSSKTQYNLAVQFFTKKSYDEAALAFQRSFEADELRRDGIAYWRAGQVEILRGNLTAAEKLLVAATTKYGAKLMVREEEIFHDAGLALYHNGKIPDAKYYMSAALSLNRVFPKALNNMGCLLVSIGDWKSGLELIQEASVIKPRNVIYSGNIWIVASRYGLSDVEFAARNHTLSVQASFLPANHCVWEFKPAEGGPGDSATND